MHNLVRRKKRDALYWIRRQSLQKYVPSMNCLSNILMSQRAGFPTTRRAKLYDVVCSRFDIYKVLLPPFRYTAANILT